MPFLPPNQQRQSTEGTSTEGTECHRLINPAAVSTCPQPSSSTRATYKSLCCNPTSTATEEWSAVVMRTIHSVRGRRRTLCCQLIWRDNSYKPPTRHLRQLDASQVYIHCVPIKTSTFYYFFEYFSQKSANFYNVWRTHVVGSLTVSAIFAFLKFHLSWGITIGYLRCIQFSRETVEI